MAQLVLQHRVRLFPWFLSFEHKVRQFSSFPWFLLFWNQTQNSRVSGGHPIIITQCHRSDNGDPIYGINQRWL